MAVQVGVAAVGVAPANAAPNTSAVALTASGQLVPLGITPGTTPVVTPGAPVGVTGLVAGQRLVGLDYRPANGALMGVGIDDAGSASVYTISVASGAATPVAPAVTLAPAPSWGVDFNPTVDRIRLVSSTGKNYRLHPDTGALAQAPSDGNLAFVASDANAGDTPAIASAAYTNNFGGGTTTPTGAKATTFFALDAFNDALVAVEAPNLGELRTVGSLGAGVDIDVDAEFDITTNGIAYAVVNVGGSETLRAVNLATGALGAASAPLTLGSAITGFAVETGTSPVVAGDDGYAVTDTGALVTFELADPSITTTIGSIAGVPAGFAIEGIDTRPATGVLYGVAVNATTGRGKLLTINRTTAAATALAADFAVTPATEFGFDFNPTVDRIRFVTSGGQNLRLHPDTGALASGDGALGYNVGDPATAAPVLTSTAYTNNFAPVSGTIHYGIDAAQNSIVTFTDSNAGKLKTVAPLSLTAAPVDVIGDTGFDVATDGRLFVTAEQAGLTRLFTLNPITGAFTASGAANQIGTGAALRAFALGRNFVRSTLTITANPQTREFGAANPALSYSASGFLGSDTIANVDTQPVCTTTATPSSVVGTYPITCTGGADDLYQFSYVDSLLTVTKAATSLQVGSFVVLNKLPPVVKTRPTARLTTSGGTPVVGALITFAAGSTRVCRAVTDNAGFATCDVEPFGYVALVTQLNYSAIYAGDANRQASRATAPVVKL